MSAFGREVRVQSAHLTQTIDGLVMQGYVIASREPASVTMVKRKQFNVVWAVVGFFLCLFPLLVYLVVYATQSDEVVFVRVVDAVQPQPVPAPLSPDGRYWWDGAQWNDCTVVMPPRAQLSPDGTMWWDGARWRPRPA